MVTRNVELTNHFDRFIDDQVASGRYENASEVLRAGLRLLEHQTSEEQVKLATLRSLAAKAFDELDQGRAVAIDGRDKLAESIADAGRRAATHGIGATDGE